MTLTRLPAGRLQEPVPSIASARWAFPIVGGIVGVIAGAVFLSAAAFGVPPVVAAMLTIGASVMVTGALHEDGLADCADGFWGGANRDRKLEIMRDSRIGAYGTLALILSVGLRVAAIAVLAAPFWSIVAVAMLSRLAVVAAIEWMPSARPEGLGVLAADGPSQMARASLVSLPGVAILAAIAGFGAVGVALVVVAFGFSFALAARRHVGGQTGDVLGGIQQVTEIAGLVALSALSA